MESKFSESLRKSSEKFSSQVLIQPLQKKAKLNMYLNEHHSDLKWEKHDKKQDRNVTFMFVSWINLRNVPVSSLLHTNLMLLFFFSSVDQKLQWTFILLTSDILHGCDDSFSVILLLLMINISAFFWYFKFRGTILKFCFVVSNKNVQKNWWIENLSELWNVEGKIFRLILLYEFIDVQYL